MKNNNDNQYEIRKARSMNVRRANTDILVNPDVVEQNATKLQEHQPRRRKRNYIKKIMNDDFLMNV